MKAITAILAWFGIDSITTGNGNVRIPDPLCRRRNWPIMHDDVHHPLVGIPFTAHSDNTVVIGCTCPRPLFGWRVR